MKNMKKRIITKTLLCLLLAFCLTVSAFASLPFTDVSTSAWYYDSVAYVYNNGLMIGQSATIFAPNGELKREDAIVLIGRVEEALTGSTISSSYSTSTPFTDVVSTQYYAKYVGWAYSKGLVTGKTSTWFGVGESITRQDYMVLIDRYVTYKGITLKTFNTKTYLDYLDSSSIAVYARASVTKCTRGNLIYISGANNFRPTAYILRSEVAYATAALIQLHLI